MAAKSKIRLNARARGNVAVPTARGIFAHTHIKGVDENFYDIVYVNSGFLSPLRGGLFAHFAGPSDDGWDVINVWRDRAAMDHHWRNLALAFSEAIVETGLHADIEPEVFEIAHISVGSIRGVSQQSHTDCVARVTDLDDRAEPDSIGALIGRHRSTIDRSGLIVEIAGNWRKGTRLFECWQTAGELNRGVRSGSDANGSVESHVDRATSQFEPQRVTVNPAITEL